MAKKRNFKLTWQKGTSGRLGRWKKIIRSRAYFDGGSGKSAQVAYKPACSWLKAVGSQTSRVPAFDVRS